MIYTVTLNPAVDKTIYVDNFTLDAVNRVSSVRQDAGGKGINVSKTIQQLGGTSTAVAFLGGAALFCAAPPLFLFTASLSPCRRRRQNSCQI